MRLRDSSLITGREATLWEWGSSEVLPLQKEGMEKDLAMLNGGGTERFELISTRELAVLAILIEEGGGAHKVSTIKKKGGGGAKGLSLT